MTGLRSKPGESLFAAVSCVFEHGALLTHGYGKTMTVNGKRRITIRVQSDICGAIYSGARSTPYYPDLETWITQAVADVRAERDRRREILNETCFCPHAGPHCHGDHGCCESCTGEYDRRRDLIEASDG